MIRSRPIIIFWLIDLRQPGTAREQHSGRSYQCRHKKAQLLIEQPATATATTIVAISFRPARGDRSAKLAVHQRSSSGIIPCHQLPYQSGFVRCDMALENGNFI
jgi:hypothetical protein